MNRESYRVPTIRDVAKRAGVSVSTVSRVLNGRTDVAEGTYQAVRDAIAALQFSPRTAARRLVGVESRTISLLFPTSSDSANWDVGVEFMMGAATAASERGYSFNLVTGNIGDRELLDLFQAHEVDGVILMGLQPTDWRVELLHSRGLPFVTIGYPDDRSRVSYVSFDSPAAVSLAVAYLASLGHRRIGFLGPRTVVRGDETAAELARAPNLPVRWNRSAGGRSFFQALHDAFEAGVSSAGLTGATVEAGGDPGSVDQGVEELFKRARDLTAIVCWWGIAQALIALQRSRRVPEDVSLIGVAPRRSVAIFHPSPTYVEFPTVRQGEIAAGMLIRRLASPSRGGNEHHPEQIDLQPTLTVGFSTAPLRVSKRRKAPDATG